MPSTVGDRVDHIGCKPKPIMVLPNIVSEGPFNRVVPVTNSARILPTGSLQGVDRHHEVDPERLREPESLIFFFDILAITVAEFVSSPGFSSILIGMGVKVA